MLSTSTMGIRKSIPLRWAPTRSTHQLTKSDVDTRTSIGHLWNSVSPRTLHSPSHNEQRAILKGQFHGVLSSTTFGLGLHDKCARTAQRQSSNYRIISEFRLVIGVTGHTKENQRNSLEILECQRKVTVANPISSVVPSKQRLSKKVSCF